MFIPVKLPNAAGSVITVTSTATSLYDLIETAAGTAFSPANKEQLNALVITNESADAVRFLADGNTPTSSLGLLFPAEQTSIMDDIPLSKMKLIRTGGSNATCSLQLGVATERT